MNTVSDLTAPPGVWLGRLLTANSVYAHFECLAELVDGVWAPVPAGGAVSKQHVHVAPVSLGQHKTKGGVWSFELASRPGGAERPIAVRPKRALPVVDLSAMTHEQARVTLAAKGIHLPEHQGRHALVLLDGDVCCLMKFEPHGSVWRAKLAGGPLSLHRTRAPWPKAAEVVGHRWLAEAPELQDDGLGTLDWTSDEEFLGRLIDRMRSALAWFGSDRETLGPRDRLHDVLSRALDWSSKDAELQSLLERSRRDWPRLSRSAVAVEELGQLMLHSEDGQRLLREAAERRSEGMRADLEISLRQDIESELAISRAELDAVRAAVRGERETQEELGKSRDELWRERTRLAELFRTESERLARVRSELGTAEAAHARAIRGRTEADAACRDHEARMAALRTADADVRERLARLCRSIDGSLQNVDGDRPAIASFAADIAVLLAEAAPDLPLPVGPPSAVPPWWGQIASSPTSISADALNSRLVDEARLYGLLADDVFVIDAMARGGELVVLTGDNAFVALSAYSRATAAGVVRLQALDPSTIGLDDLWRMPSTGRPTAFAAAWHRASARPNETVVTCLSDFDSSPFHLWLSSLHAALASPSRPPNLLVFATPGACVTDRASHPATDAMRARAAFVHAHADPAIAIPKATLAVLPASTALDWTSTDTAVVPQGDLLELATEGKSPACLRRAVSFRRAIQLTGSAKGQSWAKAWCTYLRSGVCSNLPASLAAGAEDALSLNYRN